MYRPAYSKACPTFRDFTQMRQQTTDSPLQPVPCTAQRQAPLSSASAYGQARKEPVGCRDCTFGAETLIFDCAALIVSNLQR